MIEKPHDRFEKGIYVDEAASSSTATDEGLPTPTYAMGSRVLLREGQGGLYLPPVYGRVEGIRFMDATFPAAIFYDIRVERDGHIERDVPERAIDSDST